MGFLVDPTKAHVDGQEFAAIFVSWDAIDPKVVTMGQLASELCMEGRFLFGELLLHDENQEALEQLVPQVETFARQHKRDFLQRTQGLDGHFGAPEDDADGTSAAPQLPLHMRLHLLLELGLAFAPLKLDFSQISGVLVRVSMDKAVWDQCRVSKSKLSMRNKTEVDRYKSALQALLPGIQQLEQQIAAAERAIVSWRAGVGKPGLSALALLSVVHEMTAVYAQQDATAERLVAATQDLVEITGQELARDSLNVLKPSVLPLVETYKDRDLNGKLLDYFEAWDATLVYYFEAVAARGSSKDAKDLVGFDKRLFKAIGRAGELMSQLDDHAGKVADELDAAAQAAWRLAVTQSVVLKSRSARVTQARALLAELHKNSEAGWVSLFVTWSGVATTAAGNMEGPPSILAIFLKQYVKGEGFATRLQARDGLLRSFVLIGVDIVEREAVLTLLKGETTAAQKTARDLFTNASWRSPTVFVCFYCVSAAVLIFHLNDLVNKLGDDSTSDDQLLKATLPLVQDATSVLLIGMTKYYSRELDAYLRSKGVSDLEALATKMKDLTTTPAARVARFAHRGLATATLVLSIWTLADDSVTSDKFEDRLLVGSVVGAAMTMLGAFGLSSFLGPAGVVVGFVVVLVSIGYQTWFKPKIAAAMQNVSKSMLADPYLVSRGALKAAERTVFIVFTRDVSLAELVKETVEQLNDFPWQSKLDPQSLVDYARAGLPASMVGQLYGLPEATVRKRVQAARLSQRQRQPATVTPIINLVRPGTLLVQLAVGAVNDIKLEVMHPDREQLPNNIWLEVAFPDPDALLGDLGKTPATSYRPEQVVMLFTESSTRFGRVYAGSFRLNFRPIDGKVTFEVFVPADKFATLPKPGLARASVTKELVCLIAP